MPEFRRIRSAMICITWSANVGCSCTRKVNSRSFTTATLLGSTAERALPHRADLQLADDPAGVHRLDHTTVEAELDRSFEDREHRVARVADGEEGLAGGQLTGGARVSEDVDLGAHGRR